MEDMLKEFVVEALDLASQVEEHLLTLERHPDDQDTINAVFRSFHTIKGGAGFMGLAPMVEACHLTENLFDGMRTGKVPVTPDAIEASLQASSFVGYQLSELHNGAAPDELSAFPPEIEAMLQRALAGEAAPSPTAAPAANTPPQAEAAPATPSAETMPPAEEGPNWHALYNALVPEDKQVEVPASAVAEASEGSTWDGIDRRGNPEASTTDIAAIPAAPAGNWDGAERRRAPSSAPKDDSIRIDAAKLDVLLEVAGEAAQAANQASVLLDKLRLFPFEDEAAELIDNLIETQARASRYSTELQRATLSTRMQPVGRLFQRFPRLVRELARELSKNVDLVIEGAETEVDRLVVDSLYDPLVHMLRNSLDHGVEDAEGRLAAGKPEKAQILLKAWQEANSVMIVISDDGRGMNPERLRGIAVSKGLIGPNDAQSDDEAYQLVFLPGFSTMEVASSVSGRGVGMDVVRTAVEQHRGTIWIDSKLGRGTTFSIRLPIELSIIPMLLVSTSGAKLGIPMSLVERVVELPDTFEQVSGQPVFRDQGRPLPVLSMANVLGYDPCVEQAGIVIAAPSPYILSVEALDGTADLVIKPLSGINVTGISGTTRSAEGELVLVISLSFLLNGAM
ncbi:chemotaxis protein CheA [Oxalobacter vibrioformis]|uniref:Chemotaxis protein CheA n=1 Tax=Oxalobacter vibrioformis TaxID=933080 RepID=A0A9E9M138_9BURK|nr:chemotaxis protein CheA [Oxalobacter vibrioformis]WAW11227.1 chemotaxis protein CheA [Oxalobacter vibrioformis]